MAEEVDFILGEKCEATIFCDHFEVFGYWKP